MMRIRDLPIQISGSPLEGPIDQLYRELEDKGIRYRPPCYLADEWLCPDKIPIIGIPFCLAHPRLKKIEKAMMFEVEGGTPQSCIRLLRHECGHAINYAYKLYRRTRWRALFGRFSEYYSDSYAYQPYSRRFVLHLEGNYAQAHPDEDFAETFAVWLNPDSDWRQKYAGWPVMKKLHYVDHLMNDIAKKSPLVEPEGIPPWSAARMRSTLSAFYERKRIMLGTEFQGYYDDSLKKLFSDDGDADNTIKASDFLRHHRRQILNHVARWTGHRKYDIHVLFNRFISRCKTLNLYADAQDSGILIGVTALLTTIASNTLKAKKS